LDDANATAQRATLGVDAAGTDNSTDATLSVAADTLLSLSTQEIGLDTQTANTTFTGPATGGAATPTFRSLVDADIPDDITITEVDPVASAVNGILKSDGTTLSAAIADTDYDSSITNELQDLFSIFAVATQDNIVADTNTDTLTYVGAGITAITTNAGTDTVTFTSTEVDGSTTNEFNTIQGDSDTPTSGLAISIDGGEGIDTAVSGDTLTVTGETATDTNLGIAKFNADDF